MSTAVKASEATVETTDELTKAIEAAHERIKHADALSKGVPPKTLIDTMTAAKFAELDGADELALVADQNGLDHADCEDEVFAHAA